ncbi:MAG: hypothetical protein QOD53_1617, partial [Thermoleophilaceae bacterium]|nr:hypothetical protein [Thermoleophilaceae bacterium]
GGGGGGGGATASISFHHVQSIPTVLRHGVRVRCSATAAGKCTVRVRAVGRLIAGGSRKVAAGKTVTVFAKVTSAGRQFLAHRKQVKASLRVTVSDAPAVFKRALTLKR